MQSVKLEDTMLNWKSSRDEAGPGRPRGRRGCGRWPALLGLALLAAPLGAQEVANPLATLEELVGEWSRLRVAIAEEERNWEETRDQWRAEIALLEEEKAGLLQELDDVGGEDASRQDERANALGDKDRLTRTLEGLPALLERAEADLRRWPHRLPPPLREPLDDPFRRLPQDAEGAATQSTGARLQRVLALYADIERLQNGLHVVKEMLPIPNDGRREVDTCYVGLARGFAVSPDGTWAGIGRPTDQGWSWETRTELAGGVRKAIDIARREQAAALIDLPFGITEVAP